MLAKWTFTVVDLELLSDAVYDAMNRSRKTLSQHDATVAEATRREQHTLSTLRAALEAARTAVVADIGVGTSGDGVDVVPVETRLRLNIYDVEILWFAAVYACQEFVEDYNAAKEGKTRRGRRSYSFTVDPANYSDDEEGRAERASDERDCKHDEEELAAKIERLLQLKKTLADFLSALKNAVAIRVRGLQDDYTPPEPVSSKADIDGALAKIKRIAKNGKI